MRENKKMRYYIADLHFFHANLNTKMDHRGFAGGEASFNVKPGKINESGKV